MFSFFLLGFLVVSNKGIISSANTLQELSRYKRQFENQCLLPDHPENGEIKILGQEQEPYLPKSSVILNTIIDYSCKNGFAPKTGGLARAICYQGKWIPAISVVGGCVRTCPPVPAETDTLLLKCTLENRIVNCNKAIEGTKIQVTCKPFYEFVSVTPSITCEDGSWDFPITPCQPEWGIKQTTNTEYPWTAGIYKAKDKQFYGGATVISIHFVLSAAHIFSNSDGDLLDKYDYIVAAGKHDQIFEDELDIYKQTSRIKRIYISDNFKGFNQNFISKFAILTLEDPFIFTAIVQPLYTDWINKYESSDLKEGNKRVVVGWGIIVDHGNFTEELKTSEVPFKFKKTCLLPKNFETMYYTFDKVCDEYYNKHTSVCSGDDGDSLFLQNSSSTFYIRGILSDVPMTNSGCDEDSPALYTTNFQCLDDIESETKRVL